MEAKAASLSTDLPEPAWVQAFIRLSRWIRLTMSVRKSRRLRVCETLSLGERRFVAVIEFDRQEFLVGGSGNSLSLLARLQEGRIVPEPSLPQEPPLFGGR